MTSFVIFYPYHFVRTILSMPFCPIPFCLYTILSIPFCPYHFVRYHFVLEPIIGILYIDAYTVADTESEFDMFPVSHVYFFDGGGQSL